MIKKGLFLAMGLSACLVNVAHADFVVVNKQSSSAVGVMPAPEKIQGFGKDVRFGDLLQEIIPADWFVSSEPPILDKKVDWEGGVDWLTLIKKTAKENQWSVTLNEKKKAISLSQAPNVQAVGDKSGKFVVPLHTQAPGVSAKAPVAAPAAAPVKVDDYVATGKLSDEISVHLRGKSLMTVLKILAPQGWSLDSQVASALMDTVVDYTAETDRGTALKEVLAPMGLTYLPYANMSPAPLLVIVKGE